MYTQCPHCLSVFVLEAARLGAAHGHVRCGHCAALFDALPTLCDELPPAPFVTLPRQDGLAPPPQLDAQVAAQEPGDAMLAGWAAADTADTPAAQAPPPAPAVDADPQADVPAVTAAAVPDAAQAEPAVSDGAASTPAADATPAGAPPPSPTAATTAADPAADSTPAAPAPAFAHRRRNGWTAAGWALVGLLLLTLGAQSVWIGRDALLRHDATRPLLLAACRLLHRPAPQLSDPALLRLQAPDIRPRPGLPGVLLISATLHNRAPWTQPYPPLEVTLTNLTGAPVAARVFAPASYLPDAAWAAHGLPPGAHAAISIAVRDPGRRAVAFAIRPR